jgi:predicted O-methyltransferase YrrM
MLESKQVINAAGMHFPLNSNVAPNEGMYLYNLIKQHNMTKTLEVGMAYGISALYMAQAHKELGLNSIQLPTGHANDSTFHSHIAIDPFQTTQWKGIGSYNLMKANLRQYCKVIEQESHLALPNLAMHQAHSFQLAFIDGMHLFDYTLLDFFYADLLVEENGFIVFDDAHMPSVQKVISHALTNRDYVQLDNGLQMNRVVTLQKKQNDVRRWDYHQDF